MVHNESKNEKQRVREFVRQLGEDLHRLQFPRVTDGGFVRPTNADVPQVVGLETRYGKAPRGSPARQGEGAAGWEGAARGSRKASSASPVLVRSSASHYEGEVVALQRAYPTSQIWFQNEGIWLVAHSGLVEKLDREAVFVVAVPFNPLRTAQGWGFWSRGSLAFAQWIGPRHTNFPHGSICAFDVADKAWRTGDSLITLLDIYSVWALRHLYLEYFGHWPGPQAARWPYERQMECQPEDLCGCGSLELTYQNCCRARDLAGNRINDALDFLRATRGGERSPPAEVLNFLRIQADPPSVAPYT